MSDEDLLQIKQLIEKRLKDKTGLDFVVRPALDICDFQFSVDLVFRRSSGCMDVFRNKDKLLSSVEMYIDTILYMLAIDLDTTNDLLKEKLDLWE